MQLVYIQGSCIYTIWEFPDFPDDVIADNILINGIQI